MKARILLLSFFLLILGYGHSQILITEVVSNNVSGITHNLGERADWLEIHNLGDSLVDLSNYSLSDDKDLPEKWTFPSSFEIKAKEYLIVWATQGQIPSNDQEVHAHLAINKRGETLLLSKTGQGVIQELKIPKLLPDQSYGLLQAGAPFVTFNSPTPGLANDRRSVDPQTNITISLPSSIGVREGTVVQLKHQDSCRSILYSLDGSTPQKELTPDENIVLFEEDHPPYFSLIPTRSEYRIPKEVPRFTHLRVRCLDDSRKGFSEDSKTVVFDTTALRKHNLPVLFIDAREEDFFSAEDGIYVSGEDVNYEKNGKAWKKRISWTLWESGTVNEGGMATAEIHGHATRALPQKSLKISDIRNAYYSSDDSRHIVAGERVRKFVLRSFHSELIRNEFTDFGFRDDILMEALPDSNHVYGQKRRMAVVYLNGEYWGLHSIRETSNEELIHRYTGIEPARIQLQKGASHVYQLYKQIEDWDVEDSTSFHRLSSMFDMDNLVDYTLFQLWGNNKDWPFNNIKTWNTKDSLTPYRFILFDLDATMKNPSEDIFTRFSPEQIPSRNNPDHYLFFEKIMSFREFRDRLKRRYISLKSSTLATDHLIQSARSVASSMSDEIDRHVDRWHYPRSKNTWEKSLKSIESFMLFRNLQFDNEVLERSKVRVVPNPCLAGSTIEIDDPLELYSEYKWIHTNGRRLSEWNSITEDIPTPFTQGATILLLKGKLGVTSTLVLIASRN